MNEKALKKWKSTWDSSIHESDFAAKRIKSAKSAKLTPVKIDPTDCYGYFQGTHGRYETFLDYCPCGDFHRSKLPAPLISKSRIAILNPAPNSVNSFIAFNLLSATSLNSLSGLYVIYA